MQPQNNRSQTPYVPALPQRNTTLRVETRQNTTNEQAANVVRGQIDTIYHNDPNATTTDEPAEEAPQLSGAVSYVSQNTEAPNPYERTHDETAHQISQSAWQKYHTAWQSYYQQYYERYYVSQIHETKQALQQQAAKDMTERDAVMSEEEAMYELRSDLIGKVKHRASKVRKSRHFWPIIAALGVMLVFLFLQYNRFLFAAIVAYIQPGNVDQSTIVVNPADDSTITKDDRLIIPKINVDVPIIWTANAADQNSLNSAMDNGVAWFNVLQAHSKPGENGNFVLSGHSSNDWLDQGSYKFIFAPLERMQVGDTFYVNYQQKRYMYKVTSTKVVAPTDVNALTTDNSKPIITLITCTPLGTALNRLLVFAEQVSPDPALAAAPTTTTDANATKMPTNSPTFWERLFGGGN